jgi:FdrA protein
MSERVIVRGGAYYDSVTLMLVSRAAGATDGAEAVAVGMATPLNLELLRDQGFTVGDAGPNDLVIAVRARDDEAIEAAVAAVERELAAKATPTVASVRAAARSLAAAARRDEALNLAFLSIPGEHVAYEASAALEAGLHVFCFSDGVSLSEEVSLKRRAAERGLLFMGADCGTAIIDGVALGFANAVRRGPVGIVGASGTGIQEVSCLLDAAGVGVSHAIGVGGRDLSAEVGGLMTRAGLKLLAADAGTSVIVVISKPPDPVVADAIEAAAVATGKPVVLALLGARHEGAGEVARIDRASTLTDAALRAAELADGTLTALGASLRRPPAPGNVRGLYSGGTLCTEAAAIVGGGEFTDFGDDEYTQGRAHPMIDPSLRIEQLAVAARDPSMTVLLLDVVLGYGAHPDPAADLAPAIESAVGARDDLHVIVALVGAAGDPQGLEDQRERLEAAGAVVVRGNARAAALAREAAGLDRESQNG